MARTQNRAGVGGGSKKIKKHIHVTTFWFWQKPRWAIRSTCMYFFIAPRKDVRSLPNSVFLLSNEESAKLREDFRVLVGRVLVDGIPDLSCMRSIIPQHIHHKYQKEMALKSTIVHLPMQLKDEKK